MGPDRDLNRLKYETDGVALPRGLWSPPYRTAGRVDPELGSAAGRLNSGRPGELTDDYRDNDGEDAEDGESKESNSQVSHSGLNGGNDFKNSNKRIVALGGDDDDDDDDDDDGRDKDFEKWKTLSSELEEDDQDSEISPRLGALNETGKEQSEEVLSEYRVEKLEKGDETPSVSVDESFKSKPDEVSDNVRVTPSATAGVTQGSTDQGKELVTEGRVLNVSTLTPTGQDGRTTKLPGSRTTTATTKRSNDSVQGFDDDSIAQMIAESASSHVNDTTFDIVDHGRDKVDVPITGSSNWKPVIHVWSPLTASLVSLDRLFGLRLTVSLISHDREFGLACHRRRQIVAAGSVIAIIGLLVLGFSVFNLLLSRNSSEDSDDGENNEEDTLPNQRWRTVV
ncbi:hypothetical protein Btru_024800 [Bulinus truncatus]|nr:hypothetical protein Btru_024800 [Bulinus truncatus]